jgi:hypothetical protein
MTNYPKPVVDDAYTSWGEYARDLYILPKDKGYEMMKIVFIDAYLRGRRDQTKSGITVV